MEKKDKLKDLVSKIIREEMDIMEKKKKEKDIELDVDTNVDMDAETAQSELEDEPAADMETPDISMEGGDSTEKTIGKGLQMALDAAKQLPDGEMKSKLIRQIGNTALFFLKTQIPTSGEQV